MPPKKKKKKTPIERGYYCGVDLQIMHAVYYYIIDERLHKRMHITLCRDNDMQARGDAVKVPTFDRMFPRAIINRIRNNNIIYHTYGVHVIIKYFIKSIWHNKCNITARQRRHSESWISFDAHNTICPLVTCTLFVQKCNFVPKNVWRKLAYITRDGIMDIVQYRACT